MIISRVELNNGRQVADSENYCSQLRVAQLRVNIWQNRSPRDDGDIHILYGWQRPTSSQRKQHVLEADRLKDDGRDRLRSSDSDGDKILRTLLLASEGILIGLRNPHETAELPVAFLQTWRCLQRNFFTYSTVRSTQRPETHGGKFRRHHMLQSSMLCTVCTSRIKMCPSTARLRPDVVHSHGTKYC